MKTKTHNFTPTQHAWFQMKLNRMYRTAHAIAKGTAIGSKKDPEVLNRKTYKMLVKVQPKFNTINTEIELKDNEFKFLKEICEDTLKNLDLKIIPEYQMRIEKKLGDNIQHALKIVKLKKIMKMLKEFVGELNA